MRLIGIMELLFAVVALLSAVRVNDCLWLVGLHLQSYTIAHGHSDDKGG